MVRATKAGSEEARGRPPRPSGCRQYARREFAAGLPAILRCFIEQATKGSIPHAKALMTLAGMDKEEQAKPRMRRVRSDGSGKAGSGGGARSLSELLLKELRRGAEGKTPEPAKDGR